MKIRLSPQEVALVATFAALSAIVIKILPGIPIVGVSGANIKFDAVLAPVYGMIIGPYLGFLAALVGGVITAGSPFDILTSFAPAVSALVAGFLTQRSVGSNGGRIKGWMPASAVLGLLIFGWYLTDIGQRAPFYPVLHVLALGLMILAGNRIASAFKKSETAEESQKVKPALYVVGITIFMVALVFAMPYSSSVWILPLLPLPMFLMGGALIVYGLFGIGKSAFVFAVSAASYCGIMADHMLGNLVFIGSINVFIPLSIVNDYFLKPVGLPDIPSLFMYMIPVSAAERLMFTLVATILGVGLILAIRRANLPTRKS